jgi:DNA-directed RNA polymerase subunit RPC12/RpoP
MAGASSSMSDSQQTHPDQKPRRYTCPGCGADQLFEPQDGCLVCPYCGRKETIPETADEVQERSYEQYLVPREGQLGSLATNALEVSCSSCGATVTFTPPEVAGECSFCGGKIVAQPRSADPLVAPEGVLPFQIGQPQSAETVKKWLSSLWFAPNALKKLAYQESVSGVYLPFWTYDAHTTTHYTGQRGEYYYVTETYTETDAQGRTVTKTRQVRHTRWHSASGVVSRWMDDILVPASKSLSRERLHSLEPWDLPALRPYEPAFLSGFKAQRYEVDLPQGFEEAKGIMAPVIEQDVRNDIGGDEQRIDTVATSYSAVTFKHILLPVYLGAYHFRQKVYQVMVNARTGEVQGDRPYSFWKIFFFVLFLIAVIGIVVYLANSG